MQSWSYSMQDLHAIRVIAREVEVRGISLESALRAMRIAREPVCTRADVLQQIHLKLAAFGTPVKT